MAQPQIPIVFSELMNLPQLGIPQASIKFGTCSIESDKFITVCETAEDNTTRLVIVDLANNNSVTRRPVQADSAIMNPVSKVIALRAGNQLQIFNLELKARMKSFTITDNVVFWRWISPNNIALVTATSVFHWPIEGETVPQKIFDRNPALGEGQQIISYSVSPDQKWCLLVGISAGAGGAIVGAMQLYSVERQVSQILQGHSAVFAEITPAGRTDTAQVLCFEEKKVDEPAKFFVIEVGRDKNSPGGVFKVTPQTIPVPADAPNDFPVCMQFGAKHNVVYMITKLGYVYVFDVHSAKPLYRARISTDTVFASCAGSAGNIIGITARSGQVLSISINESTLIPFVVNVLHDNPLAIDLSSRLGLEGARDLYVAEFNKLVQSGNVAEAARLVSMSPQGMLRTRETIQRFQMMQAQPGQPQPIFQYFSILLEQGKLNKLETLELAVPVLQQGRAALLEKWLGEDKLEASEEFGDMLMQYDLNLALSVYLRASVAEKAIACMLQRGEFDKIVDYAKKTNYRANYSLMLQSLVRSNPAGALEFAKRLASPGEGSDGLIDLNQVVDVFMSVNLLRETTSFLLDALRGNKKEEGFLQTKLLEINLMGGMPQVADAIIGNQMFSHYDKQHVGRLCEQSGLYQRALEHYTETNDIKRVMQYAAQQLSPDFAISYFGALNPDASLDVMKDMLGKNMRNNLNLVVQIASKYTDQIGAENLIRTFEEFKCYEGLFMYLGAIVNFSQDAQVHFKYIEAGCKMQQFREVERVCRDSTVYDAQQVKKFLIDAKLADPRPLIHVCDRYDFVEELAQYLYSNNMMRYIEVYVQKVSPQKTPAIVGKLLDLDCNEDFVRSLLVSVGQMCPVDELVEQVERRNRLRLLQPWLEAQIAAGNTATATHNAIGKIYITLNRDPTQFLQHDQFYDPHTIGEFCEKLDPSLAVIAYKRGGSNCDDDLIRVCYSSGLYKDLARHLVERQDEALWAKVLRLASDVDDKVVQHRRGLIDQVVQTALPESRNPDQVSTTVKAFMDAKMPEELIELLERIVLQGSDFSNNRSLQNLLILTAIKLHDKEKVSEYINRLDNFDGPAVARAAAGEEFGMYEEAFAIYTKCAKKADSAEDKSKLYMSAVEVLVDMIHDLDRAREFAERVNEKAVWSKVGKAQLDERMLSECIASFIRAKDPSHYSDVIMLAEDEGSYVDLVSYLKMAREDIKEARLDTQLVYSLSKTDKLVELEEFVGAPNVANIQDTGDRCYAEGMFNAARILFKSIHNNAKLALGFVALESYREAVDAAQKANSISTWKEVNAACVRANEFRLANLCGLHIIVHPDHLEELIMQYENCGHWTELMQLLEQGLGLEGAHSGIFTELGVLYSKYKPEKLMEHVRIFHGRINIVRLLKACERAQLWRECVYLYKSDKQHDSAVKTMIEHSSCFEHDLFLDCVQKARNPDVQYRAIGFYIEQHPIELERLLQVLTSSLDHVRVVHLLRRQDALMIATDYLKSVQKENLSAINDALNGIYIDEEDYDMLRQSIDEYDNFDQIDLAQKVERHELLEFRRIAAYLYKKNKRFEQSVQLSKADRMFKDAIDTAAEGRSADLVEDLLRYFVGIHDKASFSATLYTCYDLVRPDVAMELAWRHGYNDFVMPFMIQYLKNSHERMRVLEERTAPKKEDAAGDGVAGAGIYDNPIIANGPLMIANMPFGGGNMGGMNSNMGMNMGGGGMNMGSNMNMGGGMGGSMGFNNQPSGFGNIGGGFGGNGGMGFR